MAMSLFHAADYAVFSAVLFISLSIGIILTMRSRTRQSLSEFQLGNRKMSFFPTVISMVVTFISPITMLGNASEIYFYGVQFFIFPLGLCIGAIGAAVFFVPLLYPLQHTSSNMYLELRFRSKLVKYTGTFTQVLLQLLAGGLVMLGPGLIFETMADCPIWISILTLGVVSTIYTSIGGLKAVIITDTFQAFVMIAGQLAIVIQGVRAVGGWSAVGEHFADGYRQSINLLPSFTKRMDIWSLTLSTSLIMAIMYGPNQPSYQRFASLPTRKRAIRSMFTMIPLILLFGGLACLGGVTTYAYYASTGCDPYRAGYIQNQNQIIPYLVIDILNIPCVPGLFVSAMFCGSLSNISSWLSSLSALFYDDILKERCKDLSDRKQLIINKSLVILFGVLNTVFGFAFVHMKGTLTQITMKIASILVIPYGGLFIIGACFRRVNWINAFVSFIATFSSLLILCVSSTLSGSDVIALPTVTTNCSSWDNQTMTSAITLSNISDAGNVDIAHLNTSEMSSYDIIASISHLWYPFIGILIGIIFALALSIIPVFREDSNVDDRFLFFILHKKNKQQTLYDDNGKLSKENEANHIIQPPEEELMLEKA